VAVVQVDIGEASKERHLSSQDAERGSKEGVLVMKNNESSGYSEAAGVADEKRSQIPEYLASCHAGNHVVEQKSLIIVVISTGVGKSMLFTLLASCSTELIVVVVSLVLLRSDMKNQYNRAEIKCMKWNSQKLYK
jgi:superfamily II DNA helicase RecQ